MKAFTKTKMILALTLVISATTANHALAHDDGIFEFTEATNAASIIWDIISSGNPENSYIIFGGTSYSIDATSRSSKDLKQIEEAIVKDANAYAVTGEMGIILETAVKNLKAKNSNLSDEDAIDYLLQVIQN